MVAALVYAYVDPRHMHRPAGLLRHSGTPPYLGPHEIETWIAASRRAASRPAMDVPSLTGTSTNGSRPCAGWSAGRDGAISIFEAAMWNHAPQMEQQHQKRGLAWPQFEPTEAADLTAFLLSWRAKNTAATPAVRNSQAAR